MTIWWDYEGEDTTSIVIDVDGSWYRVPVPRELRLLNEEAQIEEIQDWLDSLYLADFEEMELIG